MCFQPDSVPPVPAVSGASVDTRRITLTAGDGTQFTAFEAVGVGSGPSVLVLPDVRGLYGFYEELAVRFAERGMHALAIDYFGRTAGLGHRDDEFDYMPHVRNELPALAIVMTNSITCPTFATRPLRACAPIPRQQSLISAHWIRIARSLRSASASGDPIHGIKPPMGLALPEPSGSTVIPIEFSPREQHRSSSE